MHALELRANDLKARLMNSGLMAAFVLTLLVGFVVGYTTKGQPLPKLTIGHTFTIPSLNLSVPLPPDTVVAFT